MFSSVIIKHKKLVLMGGWGNDVYLSFSPFLVLGIVIWWHAENSVTDLQGNDL